MNLIWVAIGSVLMAYFFRKRSLVSAVFIGIVLFYVIFWLVPIDYLKELVPSIRIEESTEKVSTSGAFVLSTGFSPLTPQEFTVTDSTTTELLSRWIADTDKPVVILINEGQSAVYTKNLGVFTDLDSEDAATQVLEIYNTWKTSGIVPSKKTYLYIGDLYVVR